MNIYCPNCQQLLASTKEINHLFPLKRLDVPEVTCSSCQQVSIPTLKSRSLWFLIFLTMLVTFMAVGRALSELTPYGEKGSFLVLILVYIFVNWLFTYIWPKVIKIELKQ